MGELNLLLLSGPNLSLLGERQPEVYGRATLDDHVARASSAAAQFGAQLVHKQSDSEAELVKAVHEARGSAAAIVVNAGALTHYGWSLADALSTFEGVVIELHISNPNARETWRHRSVIAPVSDGCVAGLGGLGYELAVVAALRKASDIAGAGE
jgi:3-dehydroquinate dehydratase-2